MCTTTTTTTTTTTATTTTTTTTTVLSVDIFIPAIAMYIFKNLSYQDKQCLLLTP